MLSVRERTRLLDIERQIQSEDPALARSFQTICLSDRRHCLSWWMYTVTMTFTVLMSVVMLLAGMPVAALVFHAGTWGIVMSRRAPACRTAACRSRSWWESTARLPGRMRWSGRPARLRREGDHCVSFTPSGRHR